MYVDIYRRSSKYNPTVFKLYVQSYGRTSKDNPTVIKFPSRAMDGQVRTV